MKNVPTILWTLCFWLASWRTSFWVRLHSYSSRQSQSKSRVRGQNSMPCSMWDLSLWPGIDSHPLYWKHRVPTSGLPGKSYKFRFFDSLKKWGKKVTTGTHRWRRLAKKPARDLQLWTQSAYNDTTGSLGSKQPNLSFLPYSNLLRLCIDPTQWEAQWAREPGNRVYIGQCLW